MELEIHLLTGEDMPYIKIYKRNTEEITVWCLDLQVVMGSGNVYHIATEDVNDAKAHAIKKCLDHVKHQMIVNRDQSIALHHALIDQALEVLGQPLGGKNVQE